MRNLLMTKELLRKLPPLYSQEKVKDPLCIIKFFTPWTNWTWYGIEYDPAERRFFGYVVGHENELGYFMLDELASVRGPFGLKIERDIRFQPTALSAIRAEHEKISPLKTVTTDPTPAPAAAPAAPAPSESNKWSSRDIQDFLRPMIKDITKQAWTPEYQAKVKDSEVLGYLIARFFEWDGEGILETAYAALEDANYHDEAKVVKGLLDKLGDTPITGPAGY